MKRLDHRGFSSVSVPYFGILTEVEHKSQTTMVRNINMAPEIEALAYGIKMNTDIYIF